MSEKSFYGQKLLEISKNVMKNEKKWPNKLKMSKK
jgi:hypothetical protein